MLAQVNQSNDVLAYLIISPPFFPPLQPALLPEPASSARDAQKVAQYVCPLSIRCMVFYFYAYMWLC